MAIIEADTSALLVIDVQERLAPAIDGSAHMVESIKRLLTSAALLDVPCLVTEHNAEGLGRTVTPLRDHAGQTVPKMSFDACRTAPFIAALPDRKHVVVTGCEAHVCVLQTAYGLTNRGYQVSIVRNAVGSRNPDDKTTALDRMAKDGIQIVTSEMVMFEWLGAATHPRFRDVLALIK